MSDTPNPNVFFRGDDMGIGNFPIKGGKISNQPINDGGYWFEKFKEANERIKRLEEVGDEVVINYVNSLSAFEMWRKAKEVKP
jgi:hypothetical protein